MGEYDLLEHLNAAREFDDVFLAEEIDMMITGDREVDHDKADEKIYLILKDLGYTLTAEAYKRIIDRAWYS